MKSEIKRLSDLYNEAVNLAHHNSKMADLELANYYNGKSIGYHTMLGFAQQGAPDYLLSSLIFYRNSNEEQKNFYTNIGQDALGSFHDGYVTAMNEGFNILGIDAK